MGALGGSNLTARWGKPRRPSPGPSTWLDRVLFALPFWHALGGAALNSRFCIAGSPDRITCAGPGLPLPAARGRQTEAGDSLSFPQAPPPHPGLSASFPGLLGHPAGRAATAACTKGLQLCRAGRERRSQTLVSPFEIAFFSSKYV